MKKSEWKKIELELMARWPNNTANEMTWSLMHEDLKHRRPDQVLAAVRAIAQDGDQFLPTGGQINNKLVELSNDNPTPGQVYELILEAARVKGFTQGMEWLEQQSPVAAEVARQYGWQDFCQEPDPVPGVRQKRVAEYYEQTLERKQRGERYAGIEAAGLKALEGAGPRKFGELVELTRGGEGAE
jgi:hypothetical protein